MFSVVGEYAKQEFAYTDIIGQDIGETPRLTECLRSGAKIPCRGAAVRAAIPVCICLVPDKSCINYNIYGICHIHMVYQHFWGVF